MKYLLVIMLFSGLVACRAPRPFEKKFLASHKDKGASSRDTTVSLGHIAQTAPIKKKSYYLKSKGVYERSGMRGNLPYYKW